MLAITGTFGEFLKARRCRAISPDCQPIIDRTPMKPWGGPDDIAGAVGFLCSQAAAITGTILSVDVYLIS